jgi:hypothetical protein
MSVDRTAELANSQPSARPDPGAHYRTIGIGAVRAALRYSGEPKNVADAPERAPSTSLTREPRAA